MKTIMPYLFYKPLYIAFAICVFFSCDYQSELLETDFVKEGVHYKMPKKPNRQTICHYDEASDTYTVLLLPPQAIANHKKHGDILLVDQDGDGYFPDNACGYFPMGDCDDLNPNISPGIEDSPCNSDDANCDGIISSDSEPPQLICLTGLNTYYDPEILASITPKEFLASLSDNCTPTEEIQLSMSKTTFTCEDVGSSEITITAVDREGNEADCAVLLVIEDQFNICENN